MIRRASTYLNARPILAMVLGYLLLLVVALAVLPADPADLGRATQPHHSKGAV